MFYQHTVLLQQVYLHIYHYMFYGLTNAANVVQTVFNSEMDTAIWMNNNDVYK